MAVRAAQQPAETFQVALDGVWQRFYPSIVERVRRVEDGAAALAGGASAEERVALGRAEAHRLAGLLGTFGLPRGSELARSLERTFEEGAGGSGAQGAAGMAAELHTLIEGAAPR
jgi:Hpt domain-containing protein